MEIQRQLDGQKMFRSHWSISKDWIPLLSYKHMFLRMFTYTWRFTAFHYIRKCLKINQQQQQQKKKKTHPYTSLNKGQCPLCLTYKQGDEAIKEIHKDHLYEHDKAKTKVSDSKNQFPKKKKWWPLCQFRYGASKLLVHRPRNCLFLQTKDFVLLSYILLPPSS